MATQYELEAASQIRNLAPFRVSESTEHQPYKFAVRGSDGVAVAFSGTRENAQHWCDQLNEQGFIEDPDL